MARGRERVRLQDGLKLDLNKLARQNLIRPGAAWGSSIAWRLRESGEVTASGRISADMTGERRGWLRLALGALDQTIELVALPRHYGGRQWYFRCPYTGRRASVLWRPPGATRFGSRQTWGRQVAYGSQFEAPHDRACSAAQEIRYRLGGANWAALDEFMPPKPKGMHRSTYARKLKRLEIHEAVCDRYLVRALARLRGL